MKLLQEIGEMTNMKIEQKIPEGWCVKKIIDVCPLQRGFDLPEQNIKNGKYPIVYSNGIKGTHNEYKAIAPGVVTGRSGTVGKVTYVEQNYWPHNTSLWVTDFKGNNPKFIFYKLQNLNYAKFNSGSGVPTLNRNDVHIEKILLPPLPEQEKIAGILSCWDDGIEKLSTLIEKKKIQKKALMQQLLTGKHRLKGFSTPWHEKYLVDICDFNKGQQLNKADMLINGQYPVLNGGISYSGYTNDWNTKANMITISEGGNSCGFVSFIKEKFWCGGHCYSVFDIKTDTMFLYHLLKYNENSIMNLRVGSGLPNIQISSLYKFKVFIPSDIAEQKAIAEILSKADEEIELLNKKLEAFKQEKKALMQQLLTGKIRVKVN